MSAMFEFDTIEPKTINMVDDILLKVDDLKKCFPIKSGMLKKHVGDVRAVDDINLFIRRGETLGLVGESGCGKTTASRAIIRIYEPTAGNAYLRSNVLSATGEEVVVNLTTLDKNALKKVRQEISMIFQDPIGSLNPRMTVFEIIAEPMIIHKKGTVAEMEERVSYLLDRVGLRRSHMRRYPH